MTTPGTGTGSDQPSPESDPRSELGSAPGSGPEHGPGPGARSAPASGRSPWFSLAVAVGVGLLVGVLTSYAQGLLPEVLAPLANSSGSWSVAAFLLAYPSRRRGFAIATGVLTLFAMVAGYDLASVLRGFSPSLGSSLFWCTTAVVVGPFLGWGAHALRTRSRYSPLAVGAVSGLLVGEGLYGLTVIAATTPAEYWWGSVTVGAALLVWAVVRRFPRFLPTLGAAAVAALVSVVFPLVYSVDLSLLFTSPFLF
ncbi:DUF6518 family protein [Nocardiopsis prasina]|uniref:DUF6518 family protein n=1 Tax=Nocardiopsis prasina TaxID=2015 RepID=UPI0003449E7A|nr:DUF6518 family protein [Nocardiopsis prasina]